MPKDTWQLNAMWSPEWNPKAEKGHQINTKDI